MSAYCEPTCESEGGEGWCGCRCCEESPALRRRISTLEARLARVLRVAGAQEIPRFVPEAMDESGKAMSAYRGGVWSRRRAGGR